MGGVVRVESGNQTAATYAHSATTLFARSIFGGSENGCATGGHGGGMRELTAKVE
jgi:hypothetical protein